MAKLKNTVLNKSLFLVAFSDQNRGKPENTVVVLSLLLSTFPIGNQLQLFFGEKKQRFAVQRDFLTIKWTVFFPVSN